MGRDSSRSKRRHSSSSTDSSEPSKKKKRRDKAKKTEATKKKEKKKKKSKVKRKNKKKTKKSDSSSGDSFVAPGIQPISEDDYFEKAFEFRAWLKTRGILFQDLTSKIQRKHFRRFVKAWNKNSLEREFYEGKVLENGAGERTAHKWKFSMNFDDELKLSDTKKRVTSETHGELPGQRKGIGSMARPTSTSGPERRVTGPASKPSVGPLVGPSPRKTIGPAIGPAMGPAVPSSLAIQEDEEDKIARERAAHRTKVKQFRQEEKEVLEELVPKATGFEARLEKRRAENAVRKEIGRARESSPEISQSALMGEGDSFQAKLAARRNAQLRKAEKGRDAYVEKLSAYQAKEKATMDAFKKSMGLPCD